MGVVGLTLANGDPVYVNPSLVTRLLHPKGAEQDALTEIIFGGDDKVVVKGDMDYVAFQLFPDHVR